MVEVWLVREASLARGCRPAMMTCVWAGFSCRLWAVPVALTVGWQPADFGYLNSISAFLIVNVPLFVIPAILLTLPAPLTHAHTGSQRETPQDLAPNLLSFTRACVGTPLSEPCHPNKFLIEPRSKPTRHHSTAAARRKCVPGAEHLCAFCPGRICSGCFKTDPGRTTFTGRPQNSSYTGASAAGRLFKGCLQGAGWQVRRAAHSCKRAGPICARANGLHC